MEVCLLLFLFSINNYVCLSSSFCVFFVRMYLVVPFVIYTHRCWPSFGRGEFLVTFLKSVSILFLMVVISSAPCIPLVSDLNKKKGKNEDCVVIQAKGENSCSKIHGVRRWCTVLKTYEYKNV